MIASKSARSLGYQLASTARSEKQEGMKPSKKFSILTFCLATVFLFLCPVVQAQDTQEPSKSNQALLESLRDSIKSVNEDIRLLQHFLEASTTDPRMYQSSRIKAWAIANPELRDSLFYALVAVDSSVQSEAGADVEVLATETNDVIEVRIGTAVFKGMTLKDALDRSSDKRLYERIAESYKYSKLVELRDMAFRLPTSFGDDFTPYDKVLEEFTPVWIHQNPTQERAKVDLSLYGLIFKIGPSWGGEVRVGSDEIGFPFWASGKTSYLLTYNRIKFGFELPFRPGLHTTETFPPFTIRSRRLNGTRGIVGEFDLGPVGGIASFTRLTDLDTRDLTNSNDFAYITTIVQAYYSFGISLTPTNLIRVKVGLGFHRVTEAQLVRTPLDSAHTQFEESVVTRRPTNYPSPYIKIEYLNKDESQRFGGSLQYYDFGLLTTAWLEIIPKYLSIEMKYAWPLLRDPKKWENSSFLIISPRLRFSI
jgi:hypothetical protein